jgi:hypothetical protein
MEAFFYISKQLFSVCNSNGDKWRAKRLRIRKNLGVKRGTQKAGVLKKKGLDAYVRFVELKYEHVTVQDTFFKIISLRNNHFEVNFEF